MTEFVISSSHLSHFAIGVHDRMGTEEKEEGEEGRLANEVVHMATSSPSGSYGATASQLLTHITTPFSSASKP